METEKQTQAEISIHAPARGATKMLADMFLRNYISIHAPARGATFTGLPSSSICILSIHAPARGATSLASALLVAVIFQSTLPRGERQLPSPNRARA